MKLICGELIKFSAEASSWQKDEIIKEEQNSDEYHNIRLIQLFNYYQCFYFSLYLLTKILQKFQRKIKWEKKKIYGILFNVI